MLVGQLLGGKDEGSAGAVLHDHALADRWMARILVFRVKPFEFHLLPRSEVRPRFLVVIGQKAVHIVRSLSFQSQTDSSMSVPRGRFKEPVL